MRWQLSAGDRRRVSSALLAFFALCCLAETQSSVHRKFEYKLSFKGPHLVQKDGTIPFWEHFGSMYSFLMVAICYLKLPIVIDVMNVNKEVVASVKFSGAGVIRHYFV